MSLNAPIILSRKIILSFFQNVDCKILSFSDTNIKIVMRVPHFFFPWKSITVDFLVLVKVVLVFFNNYNERVKLPKSGDYWLTKR